MNPTANYGRRTDRQRAIARTEAEVAWQDMYRKRKNPKHGRAAARQMRALEQALFTPHPIKMPRPARVYTPNGARECERRRRQMAAHA